MTFNSVHVYIETSFRFWETLIKLSKIFFSTLKDAIFIASYLGTHQLILGGLWTLYGAGIFSLILLNKPMQRERDFEILEG